MEVKNGTNVGLAEAVERHESVSPSRAPEGGYGGGTATD